MGSNNISNLPLKSERQVAKLNTAASNRTYTGRKNVYDIEDLPTSFGPSDNSPDSIIDHPNPGGLEESRPWTGGITLSDLGIVNNGIPVEENGVRTTSDLP